MYMTACCQTLQNNVGRGLNDESSAVGRESLTIVIQPLLSQTSCQRQVARPANDINGFLVEAKRQVVSRESSPVAQNILDIGLLAR